MQAKLLTMHVLVRDDVAIAQATDSLNDTLRALAPEVLDWAYDDTTPTGPEPPTVWVPDQYEEGDFLSHLQPIQARRSPLK